MDFGTCGFFWALNYEDEETIKYSIERRYLRDRYDVMDMENYKFIESFRVTKDMFRYLLNELSPHIPDGTRNTKISLTTRLAAVLNFYATGSYQRTVGDIALHSMDQSMICRSITEITMLLEQIICPKFIKFPNDQEKAANKQRFFEKTTHPGVIGCVDCTHVDIIAPAENEHIFVNRRGKHSMNVQLICNYDLLILSVCARYPGSSHDAVIWALSRDRQKMEESYQNGATNTWILGDSGYPLEPWLMTPYRNPTESQKRYNLLHARTRNPIERCNGLLKNTFRCLLGERVLRYSPKKVIKIINVCCALFNLGIINKIEMNNERFQPEENDSIILEQEFDFEELEGEPTAVGIRNSILNCF